MKRYVLGAIVAFVLWSLNAAIAHADFVFNVSLDTSGLSSSGSYGIDYQLFSVDGTVMNTATISNISLGGGNVVGSPTFTNSSSGNLTNGVSLSLDNSNVSNGSNVISDFNQGFKPGNSLSFQVDLSTNVDTTTPDQFSFAILQNYGTSNVSEIPSNDTSGLNSLIAVNITSSTPTASAYAYQANSTAYQTEFNVSSGQPSAVPEPSALTLSLISLASLGLAAGWGRLRRRVALAA